MESMIYLHVLLTKARACPGDHDLLAWKYVMLDMQQTNKQQNQWDIKRLKYAF